MACKEDVMLYIRISRHCWHSNHKHSLLKKEKVGWDGRWSICIYSKMLRVKKKHYLPSFLMWLLSIELISAAAFLLDIVVINPQFAMCGQFNGLHAIGAKKTSILDSLGDIYCQRTQLNPLFTDASLSIDGKNLRSIHKGDGQYHYELKKWSEF